MQISPVHHRHVDVNNRRINPEPSKNPKTTHVRVRHEANNNLIYIPTDHRGLDVKLVEISFFCCCMESSFAHDRPPLMAVL